MEIDSLQAEGAPAAQGGEVGPGAAARRRLGALLAWATESAWVLAIGLVGYSLTFNVSVVRGRSMAPSIADGDRILIEPWSYLVGEVSRGDVVVLRSPVEPDVDYIKRIIGLPGDEILIADDRVWVNGELLDEPYAVPATPGLFQWLRVEPEHYFVLGDNRPCSADSREFGLVPAAYLRGEVRIRLWPLARAGRL
jgi:signal peptidase I